MLSTNFCYGGEEIYNRKFKKLNLQLFSINNHLNIMIVTISLIKFKF